MEDLEARKLYQILPDREAAREGYIRVVDESGEDYMYPSGLFVPVRLPAAVVRRLREPARSRSAAARGTIRRAREADRAPSSAAFANPQYHPWLPSPDASEGEQVVGTETREHRSPWRASAPGRVARAPIA